MQFSVKKKFIGMMLVLMSSIFLSGCGFKNTSSVQSYSTTLEVWGVMDDTDAYREIFSQYKSINPYVKGLTYRKLSPETYKEDLINALASGNGPDIFMIRNAWRSSFEDKIVPMPKIDGGEKFFRDSFVDVASENLIKNGIIYSLPLSVDSLGLYYNKDIFNASGITNPPATWEEVLSDLNKLNRIDRFGNITQSAIALGTAYNINRPADILTLLMLQKGSGIGNTTNGKFSLNGSGSKEAFSFYTQFSDIGSGNYTWNPRLHYSIDAFYEGTLAMMIDYSWRYEELKKKNAKFNFAVAPLPQFTGGTPVNYANYWTFVVAKNKTIIDPQETQKSSSVDLVKRNDVRIHESWQFLRYMAFPHKDNLFTLQNALSGTTKTVTLTIDPAKKYLENTKRPAARRDLIDIQKGDIALAPFVVGNLIAKNGYQGDPEGLTSIITEMIDAVNKGERTIDSALGLMIQRASVLGR